MHVASILAAIIFIFGVVFIIVGFIWISVADWLEEGRTKEEEKKRLVEEEKELEIEKQNKKKQMNIH